MTTDSTPQSQASPTIRIGMLRLTDAAPVVMALERDFFASAGLQVQLCVEPSWANIADKLSFGHLDAAVMLPPLALAMAAGLRGIPSPIIVPMGLSLNGNSVTVNHEIADAIDADNLGAMEVGRKLRLWLKKQTRRPRFAVVHIFSTHNLLLRYWLASAGIDPNNDVEITILPPADTARALKLGKIDGFCAGAPWGSVAGASGAGRTILVSSEIWCNHPEKCLAVGRFAQRQPQVLSRVLKALLEASKYCDDPRNAAEIAAVLGRPEYLDVAPAFIQASLPSSTPVAPALRGDVDRSAFAAHGANIPSRAHGLWFLSQMTRWGNLSPGTDTAALVDAVYRPDLMQSVVGGEREPERFCDGAAFDPENTTLIIQRREPQ
ncbi:MAG: ABC transporter substrate-binding protein [Alphaproteobacteria bacterium]|nr:ABC transporter substrate-binding protein [Alphaproteobacteria bacterium]